MVMYICTENREVKELKDKNSEAMRLKKEMKESDLHFNKSLGQNFLIDKSVSQKMAEMCGCNEKTPVLEIGPGLGALTKELALRSCYVVSVEIDKEMARTLEKNNDFTNVKVIVGDLMSMKIDDLIDTEFKGIIPVVCANLPYYITSPVIAKLCERRKYRLTSATVMLQKEAADRICTVPGMRESSSFGLFVSYNAETTKLFDVPHTAFQPQPKVDSEVIQLKFRDKPPVSPINEDFMFRVIKAAYGQRRKNLINSLSSGLNMDRKVITEALNDSNIALTARAEQLTLAKYCELADTIFNEKNGSDNFE
jgi:16S rRNA (adenine1518-N6/adenine1519-N6)-dimethyltransferase